MTENLEKIKFWVIKPKAMTNMITNPSIETNDTGYTVVGAGVTKARVATYQRRGAWSLEITPVDSVESGAYFGDVTVVNGTVYTVSVDVHAPDGVNFYLKVLNTSATSRGSTTFSGNDNWTRETLTFTAAADEDVRIYVTRFDSETGVLPFYIDGLQMEANSEATTYFDGDMVGFVPTRNDFGWNGTRHGSTSYRTAKTRAGGELVYLGVQGSDDYRVMQTSGLGMGSFVQTYTNIITGGMLYEKHSRTPRTFSLKLDFGHNDNIGEIMAKRAEIIDAIRPDLTDDQPMLVRMQGWNESMLSPAGEPVDVPCVPLTPLDNIPDNPYLHQAVLSFLATDAVLPGAFHEGAQLDFADSLTNANYILYRDSDGQWQEMGTGLNGIVFVIKKGPDGKIYAGGAFTNAGGDADADHIAYWDGISWNPLGTGVNNTVSDIAFDNDGNLYATGSFTLAGGVANTVKIAKWDGSSWSPLGTGLSGGTGGGICLEFDGLGNLYCGGYFTTAGGTTVNYIGKWDGSSWSALDSGVGGSSPSVADIVFASNGDMYIGGQFTTVGAGALSVEHLAKWDGSAWSDVGGGVGPGGNVSVLKFSQNGDLYIGGSFSISGGGPADDLAIWNGVSISPLPAGSPNNSVLAIDIDKNGNVYFGGVFTIVGSLSLVDKIALLRSGAWQGINIDLPGSANVYSISIMDDNSLYIGFSGSGTATAPGRTSVVNNSGANAYPIISITGPCALYQTEDFTSEAQITFNSLTLLTGEILTMNFDPNNITIESSFRGNCLNYIAPGSDLANFYLQPGANSISLLMTGTDGDTDAVIYWKPSYWSLDQTKYGV